MVQLGNKKGKRRRAGNKPPHYADGWWLLECNRHLCGSAAGYGNSWIVKNVSTCCRHPADSASDFRGRPASRIAIREGFQWWSRRCGGSTGKDPGPGTSITAFTCTRTRQRRHWTRRQFLDYASTHHDWGARSQSAESRRDT